MDLKVKSSMKETKINMVNNSAINKVFESAVT